MTPPMLTPRNYATRARLTKWAKAKARAVACLAPFCTVRAIGANVGFRVLCTTCLCTGHDVCKVWEPTFAPIDIGTAKRSALADAMDTPCREGR